jgi:hypothetical protein
MRSAVLALALLFPALAHAQAWTPKAGEGYAKLAYGQTTATERFDVDGTLVPYDDRLGDADFRSRGAFLYAEYGLRDWLTAVALLPYQAADVDAAGLRVREVSGLGTANLGLRFRLRPPFVKGHPNRAFALNLTAGLPLGYDRNADPALGGGQLDFTGLFAFGASFYPAPAYLQAGLGYRLRTASFGLSGALDCLTADGESFGATASGEACITDEVARRNFEDEVVARFEVGYTLGEVVLLQGLLDAAWATGSPEPEEGASPSAADANLRFDGQRYVKAGAGLTVTVWREVGLGVQVFATPIGQQTLRATDVFFSVETRF